jgi:hypothetical protein
MCVHIIRTMLAIAACVSPFSTGWFSGGDPRWDPRESSSSLFAQGERGSGNSNRADASRTVLKWEQPRIDRARRTTGPDGGAAMGARLGLVSFRTVSSTLAPCDGGPDYTVALISVTTPTGANANCSTAGYSQGYQSTDNCSVNTTTTSSKPECSTNSGQSWCSTNVGMGAGPSTCSASGLATTSGVNYCSAASAMSSPLAKCSTQLYSGGTGNTSNNCSAGVYGTTGSTKSRCSAGGMGSSSPTGSGANQCSAFTGQLGNNQQQTNSCSVGSDGGAVSGSYNNCSTDGQNGNDCSTWGQQGSGFTTDFCSVQASFKNAQCTVINSGATGNGSCSSHPASVGNCSTKTSTGVNPPDPTTKLCGVIL